MNPLSILIVAAHPDDEVLGFGATSALFSAVGHNIRTCFLVGHADARRYRPELGTLESHTRAASTILGMKEPILGNFPNIELNTVPHLHLVQFIEQAIETTQANILVTQHPGDLNDDHLAAARACQAAARLFQRRPGIAPLRAMYFMETLSSTDWSFRGSDPFIPDTFVNVEREHIERKIEALAAYEGVMRPFPHSRCPEVIHALATTRGAQSGTGYAEAFQTVFRRADTDTF